MSGSVPLRYPPRIFRAFSTHIQPCPRACSRLLKMCTDAKELASGKMLHTYLIKTGFELPISSLNRLIDMYSKCGNLEDARKVFDEMRKRNIFSWNVMITVYAKWGSMEFARELFDEMPEKDCVSWNAMISGYAQSENINKALEFFVRMQGEIGKATEFGFVSVVDACAEILALEEGKQVHGCIFKSGLDSNAILGNALIDMYAKCGNLEDARQVFGEMRERDLVSWTAIITGYGRQGHGNEALRMFDQMELAGLKPNEVTYVSFFSACAECGRMEDARYVFDKMTQRNVVSWNAMLGGYGKNKHRFEVLELFCQMQEEDIELDHVSFLGVLGACTGLLAVDYGEQVHSNIIKTGFGSNVFVCSALADMYIKCGKTCDARQLFQKMHTQNLVTWTTMIAGYAQNGYAEESLKLFSQMQLDGIKPDAITFTGLINACASLASLENGEQVHAHILKSGLEVNVFVKSSIVDMYWKCGSIQSACQVFGKMPEHNVVLWNNMIAGYAHHGYGLSALQLFEQMQSDSIKPDHTTFVGVLYACSHAGLVDEGRFYFESMSQGHCITPKIDHYMHMVDLLGRSGHFNEAEDLINTMPFEPDANVWGALVSACRIHENLELGALAALHLVELEPNIAAPYILLSNIYAAGGRWDDVAKVRKLVKNRGLKKQPGCSWIVIKNMVHVFLT